MDCIFFVHKGNQPYVRTVIENTIAHNPGVEVVILGNETNERIEGTSLVMINDYSSFAQKLVGIYRHYSPNSKEFELFCLTRWFVLYEYMKKNKIDRGCHFDSDVVNFAPVDFTMGDDKFCFSFDGGHISIFNIDMLKKLCDLILNSYSSASIDMQSIYDYKKRNSIPGGIHDLTFIWLFKLKYTSQVCDLSTVSNLVYYDHNINSPSDGFEMIANKKKVYYLNGKYYLRDYRTFSFVEVKLLHLSGTAKKYIKDFSVTPVPGNPTVPIFYDYFSGMWVDDSYHYKENKFSMFLMRIRERMFQIPKKVRQILAMKK